MKLDTSSYFLPSAVQYTSDSVIVGDKAKAAATEDPDNTFQSVKRVIGQQYEEALHSWSGPQYKLAAGSEGQALLRCPARQQLLDPAEVSAAVLKQLLQHAQQQVDCNISSAVGAPQLLLCV